MNQEQTKTIRYDDNYYQNLMIDIKGLTTFSEVMSWDRRAQVEVGNISDIIRELDNVITNRSIDLKRVKEEHNEKSFINRIVSNRKYENDLTQYIEKCKRYKAKLEKIASQLQEAIDFTPNSLDEQKILLKELRQRKKELQIEKREKAAIMKEIRTDARQQSAKAGSVLSIMYDSKIAASERRRIRYAKEAALRPHEDAKDALERQIIKIDRNIFWAEKFKE